MHIKQKLQSQIGDDVQHIFDHEALFKEAFRYIEEIETKLAKAVDTLNRITNSQPRPKRNGD